VAEDEDGNMLTDEQVQDNLLLLLLAGHDTSAVTVTNMLAQLQNNPAALQQLRDEQQRVIARHGEALSGAALREMDYADAVVRCV
jgi:cytochrome P450